MFYHKLTYWRKARNAQGCVRAEETFTSSATNIDDAARERSQIAKRYHPNQIIALSTHGSYKPNERPS